MSPTGADRPTPSSSCASSMQIIDAAKGETRANNAGRKPPFCCIIRRLRVTVVFLLTMVRSSDVYLRSRTFSLCVSRIVLLRMLRAHLQTALISSASAYSRIDFLNFALLVMFSICRQRTCFFKSLGISTCSKLPLLARRMNQLIIASGRKRSERCRRVGW